MLDLPRRVERRPPHPESLQMQGAQSPHAVPVQVSDEPQPPGEGLDRYGYRYRRCMSMRVAGHFAAAAAG